MTLRGKELVAALLVSLVIGISLGLEIAMMLGIFNHRTP